jgi:hypothetical protein
MNGLAFVYLRHDGAPNPAHGGGGGHFGHVGWGLKLGEQRFFFGATENPSGALFVPPGGDNGFWCGEGADGQMHAAMKARDYDCYKVVATRTAQPDKGRAKGLETRGLGYRAISSNCADHTWWVLEAYGIVGMPWLNTHPAPADWFAALNGELHNL